MIVTTFIKINNLIEVTPSTLKSKLSNLILKSLAKGKTNPPKHASTCKPKSYLIANSPNFLIGSIILCGKEGAEPTNYN